MKIEENEYTPDDKRKAIISFIKDGAFRVGIICVMLILGVLLGQAESHYYLGHPWAWGWVHPKHLIGFGLVMIMSVVVMPMAILFFIFLMIDNSLTKRRDDAKRQRVQSQPPRPEGRSL